MLVLPPQRPAAKASGALRARGSPLWQLAGPLNKCEAQGACLEPKWRTDVHHSACSLSHKN
eukprot:1867314-Lingulodinium_polyedra.AAC.1